MANNLPNKPFICNWNARDFDPATNSIPMTAGQSFQEDLVFPNAVTTYGDTYVSIPTANKVQFNFTNTSDNPFNLSSDKGFTMVFKMNGASNASWCISDRDGSGSTYSWLFGCNQSVIRIGPMSDYGRPRLTYTPQTPGTQTAAVRINNSTNYGEYISYTDNNSAGTNLSGSWWRNATRQITFFGVDYSSEIWYGDFYWLYITNEVLTDAEIQAVIDYNEYTEVFEADKYELDFDYQGGTDTLTVTAENSWSCTTPTGFTVSPTSGGTGDTTVTVTAGRSGVEKTGTVVFTDTESNTFNVVLSQTSDGLLFPFKKIIHGTRRIN